MGLGVRERKGQRLYVWNGAGTPEGGRARLLAGLVDKPLDRFRLAFEQEVNHILSGAVKARKRGG